MNHIPRRLAAGTVAGLLAVGLMPMAAQAAPDELELALTDLTITPVSSWTGAGSERHLRAVVENTSGVPAEEGDYEMHAFIYQDVNVPNEDNENDRVGDARITKILADGTPSDDMTIEPGETWTFDWTYRLDPRLADQELYGAFFEVEAGGSYSQRDAYTTIGETYVDTALSVGAEFSFAPGVQRIPFSVSHLDHGDGTGEAMMTEVGDPRFMVEVFLGPNFLRVLDASRGWEITSSEPGFARLLSAPGTHGHNEEVPGELILEVGEEFCGGSIRVEAKSVKTVNMVSGEDLWRDNNNGELMIAPGPPAWAVATPDGEAPTYVCPSPDSGAPPADPMTPVLPDPTPVQRSETEDTGATAVQVGVLAGLIAAAMAAAPIAWRRREVKG